LGERRRNLGLKAANNDSYLCLEVPRPHGVKKMLMELRSGYEAEQGFLFSPVGGQCCFKQLGAVDGLQLGARYNGINNPWAQPADAY